MERRFNLIKSEALAEQKRVLPRFPFCYLTFKPDKSDRVYEVRDISFTGMQLLKRDPSVDYKDEQPIKGIIHWQGHEMKVDAKIKWTTKSRLGVEFIKRQENAESIKKFLTISEIVKKIKPVHQLKVGMDIPAKLKYWLRSDGPVDIYVWQHPDGEWSEFQILMFDTFIEWKDGIGIKTGKLMSKRNIDTPLLTEDEWVFHFDSELDDFKMTRGKQLIEALDLTLWNEGIQQFILRKLK
jgi:hypothetical protein